MAEKQKDKGDKKLFSCGLVMPISALDGCTADHWSEVKGIVCEAIEKIEEPKFSVKLVSDSDDVGVIQKRIVQNVYNSDIVVCDVSGKNPNVMFELGLRLAFDKATIIIKDDKTDYSFDTGIIEHVTYPRDLRFGKIVEFKSTLCTKIVATYNAASNDANHSPFLKNFGKFQVATLNEAVLPADKIAVGMLEEIQDEMRRIRREMGSGRMHVDPFSKSSEGMAKTAACITRFLTKNPTKRVADLIGDREFQRQMEQEADAPRFYKGPTEFYSTVDQILKSLCEESSSS